MAGRDKAGGPEIPAKRVSLSGRAGALGAAGVYFLKMCIRDRTRKRLSLFPS